MKDVQKATENAKKIINQKPDSAYGYIVLAAVYENQNDLNNTIDTLKKGLQVDKKNVQAGMILGNLYSKKKQHALALNEYQDIVKRNPQYIPAIFALGTEYDLMGKKKEAVKKYNEILTKSENYVPALNNLAYLYADGHGSKEEALTYAIKAFGFAPNNAGVMDTLGYVLLKNGRKDDSIKVLEKAVALIPNNPSVHYHLALAYKESGKRDEAKKHLKEAIAKGDFPEIDMAKKLLEQIKGK